MRRFVLALAGALSLISCKGPAERYVDWLYKHMPLPDNLQYSREYWEQNVQKTLEVRENMAWDIPEREFRHFVLPLRVNNETLDDFRTLYADTLCARVRGMSIADAANLKQNLIFNRLKIIVPIAIVLLGILYWAKINPGSFTLIWRYFTFVNQLIAIPTFLYATIFLYKNNKNYFITLLPGLFYIFITMSFIFNAKIGFGLPYVISQWAGVICSVLGLFYIVKKVKK